MKHALAPITEIPCELQYAAQGLPGVPEIGWLEQGVLERLHRAQQFLVSQRQGHHLLVWDPWRSRETQQALADRYHAELVLSGLDSDTAREAVWEFVARPTGSYPHGTGGVVDLTLARDGEPLDCGTGFDEFSPRAHRNWFQVHPPTSPEELRAAYHRTVLEQAMTHAGFVGLPQEWWHFEWGTRRWARTTGREPVLETPLEPPA